MKETKTITTFVITMALAAALSLAPAAAFGQNSADKQSSNISIEDMGNDLTGAWEEVDLPAENDCATGLPLPETPIIRVMYTFNQGGTMYDEDTAPFDGPYRSTGSGIWKKVLGRTYSYYNVHYAFAADKTFTVMIKQRGDVTLSRDGNSFTENGTFDVSLPNGTVVYNGCYSGTANRLKF